MFTLWRAVLVTPRWRVNGIHRKHIVTDKVPSVTNNNVYWHYSAIIKAVMNTEQFTRISGITLSTRKSVFLHPILWAHSPDCARTQYLTHTVLCSSAFTLSLVRARILTILWTLAVSLWEDSIAIHCLLAVSPWGDCSWVDCSLLPWDTGLYGIVSHLDHSQHHWNILFFSNSRMFWQSVHLTWKVLA